MMDEAKIKELSKKWAKSMRAEEGDVAGELWCLALGHPGAKILQDGEEGALFLEIRKRVGGCQISIGGTGGSGNEDDSPPPAEVGPSSDQAAYRDDPGDPRVIMNAREDEAEIIEKLEPFRYLLGVLEDLDDAANGTALSKIFGVSDRQGRNIRAEFRRGLVVEIVPQIVDAAAGCGIKLDRLVAMAQNFARQSAKRGQKAEAGDFKALAEVLTTSRLVKTPAPRKAPAGSQLALV